MEMQKTRIKKGNVGRGLFITLCLFVLQLFSVSLYWILEYKVLDERSWLLLPVDLLLLGLLVAFVYRPVMRRMSRSEGGFSAVGFALLLSLELYLMTEMATSAAPVKMTVLYNLMAYFVVALPILLGTVLFRDPRWYYILWECIFALVTVVQYYVIAFRGSPIVASDLENLESAMGIKSAYKLFISGTVIMLVIHLAGCLYVTVKCGKKSMTEKSRLCLVTVLAVFTILFSAVSGYSHTMGVRMRYLVFGFSGEEDTQSFRNAGNLLTFYYSARYERLQKPAIYDEAQVAEELAGYAEENGALVPEKKPTIIAIMNESFSDFSHIAPFDVSEDYIPFWRQLNQNAIKGYVTVSAYGGYSCNSEWEFLTGNSMYFMPSGYAAYTNCMKGPQDSLVSHLKQLGYQTTSLAFCHPSIWNVDRAYEYLGFDEMYFSTNMGLKDPEYINENITDWTAYQKLIELYENRDPEQGAFYWMTTMQNHAEYEVDVERGVSLVDGNDRRATRYLNTIRESDMALEKLLDYFAAQEEPVVIVFFGDHYPHLPSFAEHVYGQSLGSLDVEAYSRIHQTPYLVWTNQPMTYRENDAVSLNYLSLDVLEVAGLPTGAYQNFLKDMRKELPIISGFGYQTADGKWYPREDEGVYAQRFEAYRRLEYYAIFGHQTKE